MARQTWMQLAVMLAFALWASAAAAADNPGDNPGAPPDLLARAEKGDADAQVRLGNFYRADGEGINASLSNLNPARIAGSKDNDYKIALKWFLKAADQDNADALFLVGHMYLNGEGVPGDTKESIKWFRKAAALGDAEAERVLGNIYMNEVYGPQDLAEALRWYRRAARKDEPQAEIEIAKMYGKGQGVPQDYAEAEKWYDKAAEQLGEGYQTYLADMYERGDGVRQSAVNAYRWCVASAKCNQGHLAQLAEKMTSAQLAEAKRIARLTLLASALATPGSLQEAQAAMDKNRNVNMARSHLLPLAIEGNPEAEYQLGAFYGSGDGVPQDYDTGLQWYTRAAEQAYAKAECTLGGIYALGMGVAKDGGAAADWYAKAAKHGANCPGAGVLSWLRHPLGVDAGDAESVGKFRAAAESGDAAAQLGLGRIYEAGKIVGQDKFQACIWYGVAAAAKAPGAAAARDALAKQLDPEEAALAQRFSDAVTATLSPPRPKALPSNPQAAALERWRARAEKGDDDAQYQIGLVYELAEDYSHAHDWYAKSAAQDNENAQLALARIYAKAGNDAEALKWFRAAAQQGNAQAQLSAGLLDENGKAGKTNYAEAMMFLRKAWSQGLQAAILPLGRLYENGWDVPPDAVQAYGLYYYAEALKIPGAKAALKQAGGKLTGPQTVAAEQLAARAALDHGDRKFAFNVWLNLASSAGDTESQSALGRMYAEGDDYQHAMPFLRLAADKGDADSMRWIGKADYEGRGGVRNIPEAIKWYRAAAARGSAEAMNSLGEVYRDESSGFTDYPEALKWFRMAADKGLRNAQFSLCTFYPRGVYSKDRPGVAPDKIQAYLWCSIVNAGGMAGVSGYADSVAKQMTPEQLTTAQGLLAAWQPGATDALLAPVDTAVAGATAEDGQEAYKNQDYPVALRIWQSLAARGDANAQYRLGKLYRDIASLHDEVQAYVWLTAAGMEAERDSTVASKLNPAQLEEAKRRAGELKVSAPSSPAGPIVVDNKAAAIEYEEAVNDREKCPAAQTRWRPAAEKGDAHAQFRLAVACPRKVSTDEDWLRKSAEQGDLNAETFLGGRYSGAMDGQEALKWLHLAADHGYALPEFELARIYAAGNGAVAKDPVQAYKWYVLAAAAQAPRSNPQMPFERDSFAKQLTPEQIAEGNRLAAEWRPGKEAVPAPTAEPPPPAGGTLADADAAFKAKDYGTAARIWRALADKGDPAGQYKLGRAYEMGFGVPMSMMDAMNWYQKAADQGHADAQYQLADAYKWGKGGTKQDTAEALKLTRKAAEAGSDAALCEMGAMYEFGTDVPQDYAEARKWYRKGADAGGCAAMMLGALYETGKGVTRDEEEALKWYRTAAEAERGSDHTAQLKLAGMYENGKGVKQDAAEATSWFQKANCLWCIGRMYEKGSAVPRDYAEALKWYMKALAGGDTKVRHAIALLYQDGGPGLQQDNVQAYMWFTLAGAESEGAKLASKMTPEQMAEARRLAKEWKPPARVPETP